MKTLNTVNTHIFEQCELSMTVSVSHRMPRLKETHHLANNLDKASSQQMCVCAYDVINDVTLTRCR